MSAADSSRSVKAHPPVNARDRIGEEWKAPVSKDIYQVVGVLDDCPYLAVEITQPGGIKRHDFIRADLLSADNGWIFIRKV